MKRRVPARAMQLLVLAFIVASTWSAATLVRAQDNGPCGSVEKFNQTNRWEDLPGCAGYENYDDVNRTALILAKTKKRFQEFFTTWIVEEEFGNPNTGVSDAYKSEIKNFIAEADEARWRSDPQLIAARPAFEEMKRIVEQHLALKDSYPLIKKVASSFGTAKPLIEQIVGKGVEESGRGAEFSTMFVKELEDDVAKALAAGVPESTVITSYKDRTYTLAEIKSDAGRIVATRTTAVDAFKAAEEAKWRPFTSVLKGDRLAHFNRYRDSYEFRGVGGRILRTPEDFRSTPIMAALSLDDSGLVIRWDLTIWRFQGDKLVGKQTKTGWGRTAPSSAYR